MIIFYEIVWIDNCGDRGWQKRVLIRDLLPMAGADIIFETGNSLPEGNASFLWSPPHSECNGFIDRPYEFLKARIISGVLSIIPNNENKDFHKYKFTVDKVELISDVISCVTYIKTIYIVNGVETWRKSFFPEAISKIANWHWAHIGWSDFLGGGNLIYVHESQQECLFEAFIVEKCRDFFLVFESRSVGGTQHSELMNVKLSENESKCLESLMKSKNSLDCSKRYLYENNEVQGAEWR